MATSTPVFLRWIAARLERLENVSENTDYLVRLRELADQVEPGSPWAEVLAEKAPPEAPQVPHCNTGGECWLKQRGV